jgi:hypothetical protein
VAVPASAHDLALRYLLELSADIRGALLFRRGGELLASAGNLSATDPASMCAQLAAATSNLSPNGDGGEHAAIEIDVFAETGALFVLADDELMMSCVTNRSVHAGLIFYDMHAVLRDLDRAAKAEAMREQGRSA